MLKRIIVVFALAGVVSLPSCASKEAIAEYTKAKAEVTRLAEEFEKDRLANGKENAALKESLEAAKKSLLEAKGVVKEQKGESVAGPLESVAPFANGLFAGAGPILLAAAGLIRGFTKRSVA